MKQTILLFDMDGVLLHADGYHFALQSSISLIGRNIGIEKPILTKEHINNFEASGVTHEWETLAICSAILLTQIWQVDADIRIPDTIDPSPNKFLIKGEDWFTDFLKNIDLKGKSATVFAESVLCESKSLANSEQIKYLRHILGSGLNLDISPTLPIFQEFVLGSRMFAETYKFRSQLTTLSYLSLYDREVLTKKNHGRLIKWLESDYHHAVIFTNRPSQPPGSFFSTPEAELGAAAIGLEELPIIGAGSLSWLADLKSKPWFEYYKPNPVHALAALQLAVGRSLTQALNAAVNFYDGNQNTNDWLPLEGSKVYVFEDLLPGFRSARSAQQLLHDFGINIEMIFVGISNHLAKSKTLSQIADFSIEDINQRILPDIIFDN